MRVKVVVMFTSDAKQKSLTKITSGFSVGAVRPRLTTPTEIYHIYPAYSFDFFTTG